MRRAFAGKLLVACLAFLVCAPDVGLAFQVVDDLKVEGGVDDENFMMRSTLRSKTNSQLGAAKSIPGKSLPRKPPEPSAKPTTPVLPTWLSVSTNDGVLSSITVGGWSMSVGNPCGADTNLVSVAVNGFTATVTTDAEATVWEPKPANSRGDRPRKAIECQPDNARMQLDVEWPGATAC